MFVYTRLSGQTNVERSNVNGGVQLPVGLLGDTQTSKRRRGEGPWKKCAHIQKDKNVTAILQYTLCICVLSRTRFLSPMYVQSHAYIIVHVYVYDCCVYSLLRVRQADPWGVSARGEDRTRKETPSGNCRRVFSFFDRFYRFHIDYTYYIYFVDKTVLYSQAISCRFVVISRILSFLTYVYLLYFPVEEGAHPGCTVV